MAEHEFDDPTSRALDGEILVGDLLAGGRRWNRSVFGGRPSSDSPEPRLKLIQIVEQDCAPVIVGPGIWGRVVA